MEMPNLKIKIGVWDFPTRIFHWSFALSFLIAIISQGDSRYLHIHVVSGLIFFLLLIFRIIWGFCGSRYSKFRSFTFSIRDTLNFTKSLLRLKPISYIGHNPLGSLAIYSMLLLGLLISISGLIVLSGEERIGPMQSQIPFTVGVELHIWHELFAWIMLGVVTVHVTGVVIESKLHHQNLVLAMITGYKRGSRYIKTISMRYPVGITLLLCIITGTSIWVSKIDLQASETTKPFFKSPALATSAQWSNLCGECHLAFHPALLPVRSWEKILDQQSDHFGEDLYLENDEIQTLRKFALQNAAETQLTEASLFMASTLSPHTTPIQIIKTSYWQSTHAHIDFEVIQQRLQINPIDCDACHLDADTGVFQDTLMRIPKKRQSQAIYTAKENIDKELL